MSSLDSTHIGRSFSGTRLEDDCPCLKAPCGLVSDPSDECDQHALLAGKTLRQIHSSENCPGRPRQRMVDDWGGLP